MATSSTKTTKTSSKLLKYGCLPIIGLTIFLAVVGSFVDDAPNKSQTVNDTTELKKEPSKEASNIIPGLAPVDVYLNLENEGFKTEKNFSSEFGNSWISKKTIEGIEYQVSVFSSETENVESVKATAMIDPSIKSIMATQQFIMYVASLPFENAKPEETVQWVKDNFNNDKATKIVSDVKFTIYAPTKMVRMLTVERNYN